MNLDLASLLEPVGGAAPAGPDLQEDPATLAFEQAAAGRAERRSGDAVLAAAPPDWAAVLEQGAALLRRSKDVGVAIKIAQACTATRGFAGLADGLALMEGLLEQFWGSCHPALDPADPAPAETRATRMRDLVADPMARTVRELTIVRGHDQDVTVRHLLLGTGRLRPPDGWEGPDAAGLRSALDQVPATERRALFGSVEACRHALDRVLQVFAARAVAPSEYVRPEMLGETLDATAASLRELLPAEDLPRTVPVPSPVPGAGSTTGPAAQGSTATSAGGEGVGPATSDTREQIAAGLERMCRSLEAREPSSPVPLVLRGAKQMLTMSFLELSRHSDLFEKLAALDGGTRKGEES